MNRIIGIGDNVVDIYMDLNQMFPGGNALNVPVLAHRFGDVEAAYLGVLGNDRAGKHVLNSLCKEDIDTSRVRIVEGTNAYAKVTLVQSDRVFVESGSGVSPIAVLSEEDYGFIKTFDIIHTSVYSMMEDFLPRFRECGKVAFDFSDRRDVSYLKEVCPYVHYAFLSGSELSLECIRELQVQIASWGPEMVLVTRGSKGAILYTKDTFYEVGIETTEVLDTLGAGDAFIARLLVGIMQGEEIEYMLESCKKASSKVCSYYGAFGYPMEL